jgi:GDPmannose 4,6-dehydratase
MLEQPSPNDYVIATRVSHSVGEFLDLAAAYCGLDWTRWVGTDSRYFRPAEVDHLSRTASKARRILGWDPRTTFEELVRMMVGHDLELAMQEDALRHAGHTYVPRRHLVW